MNYNQKTVEAYCKHVVKVNQQTPTTYTLGDDTCSINYAVDINSYVKSIQAGGQYRYEVSEEKPFTQDDLMFGMVLRRVQRNGVKLEPGVAGTIYHVRTYSKNLVYIGAGTTSVSYRDLAKDYEYAIDLRAWSTTPNASLEWRPAKKVSPHHEFSPSYASLMSVLIDEPKFDEDPDDDL